MKSLYVLNSRMERIQKRTSMLENLSIHFIKSKDEGEKYFENGELRELWDTLYL